MRSIWFKVCFVIFVVGAIVLSWVDNAGPSIIAFELAKTIENANAMVAAWQELDVVHLKKFSLFFDYVFIIGYAGSLYFILQEWWLKSGKKWVYIFSFIPILAGILDGIENFGLLQIIYNHGSQFSASLAFYCASIKFAILLPSILGAVYYLFLKWKMSR